MKQMVAVLLVLVLVLSIAVPAFAATNATYYRCNGRSAGRTRLGSHEYNGGMCSEWMMYSYCTRYVNNVAQETNWHSHQHLRYHDTCTVSSQTVCGHSTNH